MRHPADGLDDGLESPPLAPRPGVTEGGERHVHEPWAEPRQLFGPESEAGERARPVGLAEDVAVADESPQPVGVVGLPQIERRRELAQAGVDHQAQQIRQVLRRDVKHVGAVAREGAAADRPRDDAREVEHADSRERARARAGGLRRRLADLHDLEKRQLCDRETLRMGLPLRARAHHARGQGRRGERVLQVTGAPLRDSRTDSLARVLAAEDLERSLVVMRHVGVDLDPAGVTRLVEAEERIAEVDVRLALGTEIALAPERGDGGAQVDRNGLAPPRPQPPDLAGCERAGGDHGGGRGADLEVRGQDRVGARERDALERGGIAAGEAPQRLERDL